MLAIGTISVHSPISIIPGDTMSLISRLYVTVPARKRAEAQFAALRNPGAIGLLSKKADSAALTEETASRTSLVRRGLRGFVPHTSSLRSGS
jgi:hypothetical protein